jgi:hypothetical protein
MMITMLPTSPADAGLSATKKIEITAKLLPFVATTALSAPTQPTAAVDPDGGALYGLATSLVAASALVGITLY